MALTKSIYTSKLCVRNSGILFYAIRNGGHWYKDYRPGPFPKTEEERIAAAKKYELLPSEYKPYPDDGNGWGDYPDLPLESGEAKDPFYPWDNPELLRNFNEPMHVDHNMYSEDRYNISKRLRVSIPRMFLELGAFLTVFCGLILFSPFTGKPVLEKQYPKDGVKHYTFERI